MQTPSDGLGYTQLTLSSSELLSVAAHELKSPLATIRTIALVGQDESEPEELQSLMSKIVRVSESALSTVDAMLDIERVRSGYEPTTTKPLNLVQVVNDVAEELLPLMESRKHTLRIYERSLPPVFSDEKYLKRILHNLVENAAKYSSEGKPIEVRFRVSGSRLSVRVRDYGIGISKADWQNLFKKFGRMQQPVSSHASSSGLGLYVCQQLADMLGGEIYLQPKRMGSCFVLELPIIEQLSLWRASAW